MRTVPVRPVGAVDPATLQAAADTFGACHTLVDLMRWTAAQRPSVQVAEIVTQDEYTHDVVLPFGTAFLSFDTTGLGSITAVAVWTHQPDADELLGDRLAQGWTPTASGLKSGDRVLGHAACVLGPKAGTVGRITNAEVDEFRIYPIVAPVSISV